MLKALELIPGLKVIVTPVLDGAHIVVDAVQGGLNLVVDGTQLIVLHGAINGVQAILGL
jgi:hypothetical protein